MIQSDTHELKVNLLQMKKSQHEKLANSIDPDLDFTGALWVAQTLIQPHNVPAIPSLHGD